MRMNQRREIGKSKISEENIVVVIIIQVKRILRVLEDLRGGTGRGINRM